MENTSKKYSIFVKLDPIKTTVAYDTYWRFAHERQNIFFNRALNTPMPLTQDLILQEYKFTNAYRACDRVSQFLIRDVIYNSESIAPTANDQLFRIILFKLFNRIETWQLLEKTFGPLKTSSFNVMKYKAFLDTEMNNGRILYSNAYMMASGCSQFEVTRKHHAHLLLLDLMIKDNLGERISECKSMSEGYAMLLEYPLIGRFLAYQYITDINYSCLTNFSESEFTVPGPGARDGIRKCFSKTGGLSESDLIKLMADRQEFEFERLGLRFKRIGNRPLQYIDTQNLFCEVDKYCRIAHPELEGFSGRTRIKQKFKKNAEPLDFYFPPKWDVNLE